MCSIATTWLAATFARGPGSPIRLWIKPDRKGAALLQGMNDKQTRFLVLYVVGFQLLIPNRDHAGVTPEIPVIHHLCNKAPR